MSCQEIINDSIDISDDEINQLQMKIEDFI